MRWGPPLLDRSLFLLCFSFSFSSLYDFLVAICFYCVFLLLLVVGFFVCLLWFFVGFFFFWKKGVFEIRLSKRI